MSAQQTSLIAGALAANPDADPNGLVEKAKSSSHNELRNECERLKAAGDKGAEEGRQRIHDERFLRRSRHADGSASLTLRDNPEVIAQVVAGIQPKRQELFDAARRAGRRERSEALDADALVATVTAAARGGVGGGARKGGAAAKVLVRVDFDTLLRGYTIDGEVCEIAGYGPVSVSAVRDLLATGNGFLAAIVTKGEKVFGLRPRGTSQRRPLGARPACGVGGVEGHLDRLARPAVQPLPRPQDAPRLGARRGHGQTPDGASRRPAAPATPATPAAKTTRASGATAGSGSMTAMTNLDRVRTICLALPEVTERPSHGAPTWFVRDKKTFVTFWVDGHHDLEFPHLWTAAGPGVQEELVASEPDRFFRPPYVGHRGWLGVRMDGAIDWDEIEAICTDAFRCVAPKTLVAKLKPGQ